MKNYRINKVSQNSTDSEKMSMQHNAQFWGYGEF